MSSVSSNPGDSPQLQFPGAQTTTGAQASGAQSTANTQKTNTQYVQDSLGTGEEVELNKGAEHNQKVGTNSYGNPVIEEPSSSSTLYGGGKWFTSPALLAFYEVMAIVMGKLLIEMEKEMAALTINMMEAEFSAAKDSKELGIAAAELEKKMAIFAAVGCFVQAAGSFAAGATTLGMLGASRGYSSYQDNKKSAEVDAAQARQDRINTYQTQHRDDRDGFNASFADERNNHQIQIDRRDDNRQQLAQDKIAYQEAERNYANDPSAANKQARDDAQDTVTRREIEGQELDKQLQTYDDMKAVSDANGPAGPQQVEGQAHLDKVAQDLDAKKADYERLKNAQQASMTERTTAIQAASQMMGAVNSLGQSLEHIGKILYVVQKAWYEGEQKLVETEMRHYGQLISSLVGDRQDMQKTVDSLQDTLKGIFQQTTQNQRISSSAA